MKTIHPNYPHILEKTSETEVTIFGNKMTTETFCRKMQKMGFDYDYTVQGVKILKVGGEWHLCFTSKQMMFLKGKKKPSGF